MYKVRVLQEIDDRLDAEYYNPAALSTLKKMENKGTVTTFGSLVNEGYRVVYHGTDSISGLKDSEVLPFLSPTQIDPNGAISFDDADKLPLYYMERYPKGLAKAGEILVEVKGNVSKVGIVPLDFPKNLMISGSLYKATLDPKRADSHYVLAFLKSRHGQILKNRLTSNTIINYIAKDALYSIPVIEFGEKAQKYIGDKVRQAEQLRAWAKRLDSVLQTQIRAVFKGDPKPHKKIGKVLSVKQLSSLRLEAEYYGDLELWAEFEIKNSPFPNQCLGDLALRIKDGPGGWGVSTNDYRPIGIPVIRSVNLVDGRCELDDCVFISKDKHDDLKAHQVKPGALLLSVRGTIGRAAVFDNEIYNTASLNAAVVTIDCKPTINPYYLAAFLNSEVGRIQSNRIANGAVQLNMNLKETASNLIVVPPTNLQQQIAGTFVSKNRAVSLSNVLTDTAKTLVEALIEGQLTEQQFIQAQQALEDGDNSLDQAILSKLSSEGYGIEGATPLFGDIDELYRLLESATQAEAEE
ncbi:restriction endonuclease subunit S [Vibrio parahaemolyticus]|nr:restriction endonuclease subunit S [Vibrio parahaemolyticus]